MEEGRWWDGRGTGLVVRAGGMDYKTKQTIQTAEEMGDEEEKDSAAQGG